MNKIQHRILNTLFVDVETVSQKSSFEELTKSQKALWRIKAHQIAKRSLLDVNQHLVEDLYQEKAAIYAEFGKIICISVGAYVDNGREIVFRTKSFYGNGESDILQEFSKLVKRHYNKPNIYRICGHNIREFDIPYICRRALINGVQLPSSLRISGMKHWQLGHLMDTMQLWKFGDYKHYTSLDMLCNLFEIPSPKISMDGSMVGERFWKDNSMESIVEYCEQDVEAVAMLYAKMVGEYALLECHMNLKVEANEED